MPALFASPFLYLPAIVVLALVEPIAALVTALGLFALWAGLRNEA